MSNEPNKVLNTRAKLSSSDEPECDHCGLPLVFALKTASGEAFSVDLPTILQCLKVAEQKGYTPEIDVNWWNSIRNHFNL